MAFEPIHQASDESNVERSTTESGGELGHIKKMTRLVLLLFEIPYPQDFSLPFGPRPVHLQMFAFI